ncbi:hypothetical protein CDV55_103415 [Aspergillus turcosus]|uniref:Uncharacterized protein n=1 Tax=Aspergillus turcosus TaxID=1245748 RepID=A0A397HL44_9EURO|nr:hypothetical protein CDV55_103415 [Aspergillus turcosus]RLL98676.1 hypothetical protein CFD26_103737 [Aspergillus turcosus]
MSRLSKLGYSLSSSSASSSFSSSVSPFKDRRTPTIPCRSFVPDCSPIRSAGVPSFTEVRRGSYLATRSSRASATAPATAPARSAPSTSAPSTRSRFLRAPPSDSRGAAQQDPLDAVHSIMERARLRTQHIRSRYGLPERPRVDPRTQSRVELEAIRSRYGLPERPRVDPRTQSRVELEAIRSRYGLPERPRVDPRTQPRVEPASTPSIPTTRPTRFGERIRVLAEETAACSAKHRASLSKLAAFDEVVARVRARKQSTPSAPSIDSTRPVTHSERVRPSALSVNAARPITRSERVQPSAPSVNATRSATRSATPSATRSATLSERVRPSAPSANATRSATRSEQARPSTPLISDRISDLRAARAERRRWLDEMIAQQEARASAKAASDAAIEEFRAKRQARLANRSREGHLTSPHPAPTNSIRSTAIPAADLVRTRPSTSADRLRRDKPAKRVRFEEVVTVQPVSRWIVKTMHVHKRRWSLAYSVLLKYWWRYCSDLKDILRGGFPFQGSAKGGAPPRRADAETDTEDCVPLRRVMVAQSVELGWFVATLERLY